MRPSSGHDSGQQGGRGEDVQGMHFFLHGRNVQMHASTGQGSKFTFFSGV